MPRPPRSAPRSPGFVRSAATLRPASGSTSTRIRRWRRATPCWRARWVRWRGGISSRSEEHTSELQSPVHLVCRLLLEKKNNRRRHSRSSRCPYALSFFCFESRGAHRDLHSFPTRRSSDLPRRGRPASCDRRPRSARHRAARRPGFGVGDGQHLAGALAGSAGAAVFPRDRKSTRLNSSHPSISYAVFCLKKKTTADATLGPAVVHMHLVFFVLNLAAPTEIYTLSLHDALPIFRAEVARLRAIGGHAPPGIGQHVDPDSALATGNTLLARSLGPLARRYFLEIGRAHV